MSLLKIFLKNAPAQGLFYSASQPLQLSAFCDADWGACPITRRSITGYAIMLGSSLISCYELAWLARLLHDMQVVQSDPVSLFCDNQAALHLARNPVFHERTKHIELDCHIVRQYTASGLIRPRHVSTGDQAADLFTKGLSAPLLQHLSSKLNVSNFLHTLSLRGGIEVPDSSSTAPRFSSTVTFNCSEGSKTRDLLISSAFSLRSALISGEFALLRRSPIIDFLKYIQYGLTLM